MAGRVKVTLDRAHLAARMQRGKDHCGPILAQQIIDDSRRYTPKAEGDLIASARVEQIGENYAATWNRVYAAYQWYGCWPDGSHVIRNHNTNEGDGNPEATTQWAEHAKKRYGKDWETVAQREFTKGAS